MCKLEKKFKCLVVTSDMFQWFLCNRKLFLFFVKYSVNLALCILKWGCECAHSYHSCVNICSSGAAGMKFLLTSDLEGNDVTVTFVSKKVQGLIFQLICPGHLWSHVGVVEQIARDINSVQTWGRRLASGCMWAEKEWMKVIGVEAWRGVCRIPR